MTFCTVHQRVFLHLSVSTKLGLTLPLRVCARPRKVSVPAFRKCSILPLLLRKIYIPYSYPSFLLKTYHDILYTVERTISIDCISRKFFQKSLKSWAKPLHISSYKVRGKVQQIPLFKRDIKRGKAKHFLHVGSAGAGCQWRSTPKKEKKNAGIFTKIVLLSYA